MPQEQPLDVLEKMSEKDQEALASTLDEWVTECEEFFSVWEEEHSRFLEYYLCVPEYEVKQDPWEGASNLFLPVIRSTIDGLLAQFHDALISNDPFMRVRAVDTPGVDSAKSLTRFYSEYVYKRVIPFKQIINNWLFDTLVYGTGAVKTRVENNTFLRRRMESSTSMKNQTMKGEMFGQKVESDPIQIPVEKFEEKTRVERVHRPVVENTDMFRILVPPDSSSTFQFPGTRYYIQRQFLTHDQLLLRRRAGYKNIDEALFGHLGQQNDTDGKQINSDYQGTSAGANIPAVEVLEISGRLVCPGEYLDEKGKKQSQGFMDDDGLEEEFVITYFPATKKISRIVPLDRIRQDNNRSHLSLRFNEIPRFFYGQGVAAKLQDMQAGMNAFFNQMVDYGTIQNLPFYFFEPAGLGEVPERLMLEPGAMIPTLNASSVHAPRLQGDFQFWISAMNQIQAWSERDGMVPDFTKGVSPSRPNAPNTARATIAMIQNANVAFSWKTAQIAEKIIQLFHAVHECYRQVITRDQEVSFYSEDSGSFDKVYLTAAMFRNPIEIDYVINPNRQAEQQMHQMMFSMLAPYVMQAAGGDPNSVRPLAEKLYNSAANNTADFEKVWPPAPPAQAVGQQLQGQPGPQQQQQGPPQQGGPMPGGNPNQGPV